MQLEEQVLKKYSGYIVMTLLLFVLLAICLTTEEKDSALGVETRTGSAISFRIPAGETEEVLSWWAEDAEHRPVENARDRGHYIKY